MKPPNLASLQPSLTASSSRSVRAHRRSFLDMVRAADGRFRYIPTGNARPAALPCSGDQWDGPEVLSAPGTSKEVILTVQCPLVAYRQGAAVLCAAYGLASAMHEYGDAIGATDIAGCARAALSSSDAFTFVTDVVRKDAAGWSIVPIPNHDPLTSIIDIPVNLQLVGSDGAGTHAVATLGGLIFDAAEPRALPLSRAALDHSSLHRRAAQRGTFLACCARSAASAGQEPAQAVAEGVVCVVTVCEDMERMCIGMGPKGPRAW